MGPFGVAGPDWLAAGIPVIPLGGVDGKVPLVRNAARFTLHGSKRLLARNAFGDANLGFCPGAKSGLTVVDIDAPGEHWLKFALERFGDTPIKVQTATGKHHLYYRWRGERRQIRPISSVPIDVLGNGVCVAPPSERGQGAYRFIEGGLDDFERAPSIRDPHDLGRPQPIAPVSVPARRATEGARNDTLFRCLLRHARACDDLAALMDIAQTLNAENMPPLSEPEVAGICRSAWKIEQEGRNWTGSGPRAVISADQVALFKSRATEAGVTDALLLLLTLEIAHRQRDEPFAVSPRGMASANLMKGWDVKRYRRARDRLIEMGFLIAKKLGGLGARDPHLFHLSPKGPDWPPNITNKLPSL